MDKIGGWSFIKFGAVLGFVGLIVTANPPAQAALFGLAAVAFAIGIIALLVEMVIRPMV